MENYIKIEYDIETAANFIKTLLSGSDVCIYQTMNSRLEICIKDNDMRLLQEKILEWLIIPERIKLREAQLDATTTNGLDR